MLDDVERLFAPWHSQLLIRKLQAWVKTSGVPRVRLPASKATAEAVLSHDERELGSLLIDIGSGTTEFAYFCEGEVQHSAVLPIGSGHFTNDLAMVLRTPFAEAESIKTRHGCCLEAPVDRHESCRSVSCARFFCREPRRFSRLCTPT